MRTILGLLKLVFILGFLGVTEGLRCIDCGYREIINPDNPQTEDIPRMFPHVYNFPFNDHPSCTHGKTADPLLSVDCANHRHLENAFYESENGGIGFYHSNPDEPNVEYKCIAIFMQHNQTTNGTVNLIKESYRTCLEKIYNVKDLLKLVDEKHGSNVVRSAIECETDNCNDFDGNVLIPESKSSKLNSTKLVILFGVFITYWYF